MYTYIYIYNGSSSHPLIMLSNLVESLVPVLRAPHPWSAHDTNIYVSSKQNTLMTSCSSPVKLGHCTTAQLRWKNWPANVWRKAPKNPRRTLHSRLGMWGSALVNIRAIREVWPMVNQQGFRCSNTNVVLAKPFESWDYVILAMEDEF